MTGPRAPGPDGLRIAVRLTPRSARDALAGPTSLSDGRSVPTVRVRAVPEDNRANAALAEGATSRVKLLFVAGAGAVLAKYFDALPSVRAAVRP